MPIIDKAKVYAELLKLKIDLVYDDIPTPAYIQERIFECNEQNRRVEKYCISVKQELSEKKRQYNTDKFSFDARKRQALTNNEKIKKLPTGKEREAAVEELFEEDLRNLMELENEVNGLKDLLDAITIVQNNLKGTATDIRMLARVMEQQINRLNIGTKEDPEIAAMSAVYKNLEKQMQEDLEKEMEIDDVETSTETTPDESDDESSSGSPITVDLEEDGQDSSESTETGSDDESEAGKLEATPAAGGQEPENEKEDDADVLNSFLVDDSEDNPLNQDRDDESKEEQKASTESQSPSSKPNEVEIDSDAQSVDAPANPKVEFDLDDLGINIDGDDVIQQPTTPEKVQKEKSTESKGDKAPSAKGTASNSKKTGTKSLPVEETKKPDPESTPNEVKTESSKKEITDVDLDEILSSF